MAGKSYIVTTATDKNLVAAGNVVLKEVNIAYVGSGTPQVQVFDSATTSGGSTETIFDTILTPVAGNYHFNCVVKNGVAIKTVGSTTAPSVTVVIGTSGD